MKKYANLLLSYITISCMLGGAESSHILLLHLVAHESLSLWFLTTVWDIPLFAYHNFKSIVKLCFGNQQ